MKVRCLRPGLPKRISTHPKARGIKSAADITIHGRLTLKVVVFEKQRDMVHFWTEVLGKPHLGRSTLGAVNARLGFTLTREFVEKTLGVAPTTVPGRNAAMFRPSQFKAICNALAAHIANVGAAA